MRLSSIFKVVSEVVIDDIEGGILGDYRHEKSFLGTMDMDGDHLALPCPYPVLYGNNIYCYILIEKNPKLIFCSLS